LTHRGPGVTIPGNMLVTLNIRDFALIDRLTLDLGPGLTVFTGETGAGKSLVIQAFSLLLGERASADLIRHGSERAGVEAQFDVGATSRVRSCLQDRGLLDPDNGDECELVLVSRDIGRNARTNRNFVNGRLAPLAVLREIGDELVDLHGQHEHQRLLRTREHLAMLDDFASKQLFSQREKTRAMIDEYRSVVRSIEELASSERERAIELSNLEYQLDEIDVVAPRLGEGEELDRQHRILANAERLRSLYFELEETLTAEGGVVDSLRGAWSRFDELCSIMPETRKLQARYHDAVFVLEDVASELGSGRSGIELDEERLGQVEERIAQLARLTRKYGPSLGDVLDYRSTIGTQLEKLQSGERDISALQTKRQELVAELSCELAALTRLRAKAARRLEKAVCEQLSELGMAGARFQVDIRHELDEASEIVVDGGGVRLFADGIDRAEFLMATNPGEKMQALVRIASGGEVSRVMLAIKAALASKDLVPIMVFDEVDVGIGGETAWHVAEKLHEVSRSCQCLVITHLPQIAAKADSHFRVAKRSQRKRTVIDVVALRTREERVDELARMLGGTGAKARGHAAALLDGSEREGC